MSCIKCEVSRAKLRVWILKHTKSLTLEQIVDVLNQMLSANYYFRIRHFADKDVYFIERRNTISPFIPYLIYEEKVVKKCQTQKS